MATFLFLAVLRSSFQQLYPEAGCDEAGRGPLAGPVVAAAVIFPSDFRHEELKDSKKLSHEQRIRLKEIIEREAIAYAVSFVDEKTIDEINILNASILAMHRALDALAMRPAFVIVDGNRFKPYLNIPFQTIVKGDNQ
ncbi:MAG: ribonuclease HII, partial [Chitinophagales bacterium]|nr:ribonuclease HII [Chitinophagales bacterium]